MNTTKLQTWFPTSIYYVENLISEEDNDRLIEYIKWKTKEVKRGGENWLTDVYNTHHTHNIHKDNMFNNLSDAVTKQTSEFAKKLGSNYDYNIDESWWNSYNENDYQEYHHHADSYFSAVYWFTSPEGSGDLVFQSPLVPNARPLKNLKSNPLTYECCRYNPPPRSLVIFPSTLMHMVVRCKNKTPRITGAFNLA